VFAGEGGTVPIRAGFSDIGWRPLLKVAINRTGDRKTRRKALKWFHEEFGYLSMK